MAPATAERRGLSFAPSQALLPSTRLRSSVPLASQPRPRRHGTRLLHPPRACVSVENEEAVKAAKRVYKAAKAEYKARKAEYKALKAKLETRQKPDITDIRTPPVVVNPVSDDAVAVCDGKACSRMGADAVAMLLGKQTLRAPCMKMCGGAGPSVRVAGDVVKVDLKKAVRDAVPTAARRSDPLQPPSSTIQANSVLELLGDPIASNIR